MPGTRSGGLKAARTNKQKYGKDFYKINGRKGGIAKVPKGFALDPALAIAAGAKGGSISRRGPAKPKNDIISKGGKMHELTLTYHGVVTAKKNSKQIIWNRNSHRPMLISNRRARKQENDMVQSFMLDAYGEGWRGGGKNSTFEINICIWNKDRRRRDLDNQATAIIDALVLAHIIPDDGMDYVQKVCVEYRGQDKEDPRAVVKIKETAWEV